MINVAKPTAAKLPMGAKLFAYRGKGLTSRKQVELEVFRTEPGSGITFHVKDEKKAGGYVEIPARAQYVVNTLRNVVLGREGTRLCIVEHFLAAVSLWGLEDLKVVIDGPELPLDDGSANFWIELLVDSGLERNTNLPGIDLKQPIIINKGDRSLILLPDTSFSVTYLMDWNHPKIGKRWQTWSNAMPVQEITQARTFGSLKEHQMLGLADDVVSMTEDGFTEPLRFEDEPVRHKLLDLIGDLALAGVNPLRLNARVISVKAGHEMDVQMAKEIGSQIG